MEQIKWILVFGRNEKFVVSQYSFSLKLNDAKIFDNESEANNFRSKHGWWMNDYIVRKIRVSIQYDILEVLK